MIRFAVLALVLALAPSVVHADDAKNDPYADSGPAAEFASTRLALAPADGSDKPAEAGGADNNAVKRVRKVAAPATAADGKGE